MRIDGKDLGGFRTRVEKAIDKADLRDASAEMRILALETHSWEGIFREMLRLKCQFLPKPNAIPAHSPQVRADGGLI